METLKMATKFEVRNNPIPWIDKWFDSDSVQVAPQEVELSSYLTNQIDATINKDELSNIDI